MFSASLRRFLWLFSWFSAIRSPCSSNIDFSFSNSKSEKTNKHRVTNSSQLQQLKQCGNTSQIRDRQVNSHTRKHEIRWKLWKSTEIWKERNVEVKFRCDLSRRRRRRRSEKRRERWIYLARVRIRIRIHLVEPPFLVQCLIWLK